MAVKYNSFTTGTFATGTPNRTTPVSFSFWYNNSSAPTSFPNRFCHFSCGQNISNINYSIIQDASSWFLTYTTSPATYVTLQASLTADSGVWHHFACTTDWSTAGTKIYVDGVSLTVSSGGATPGTPYSGSNANCYYGQEPDNTSDRFAGHAADAAMWDTTLTAGEVAGLFRGERPSRIRPASLLVFLPLYGGGATTEPDLSGKKLNLTVGAPLTTTTSPPVGLLTRLLSYIDVATGGGTTNPKTVTVGCTTSTTFVRQAKKNVAVASTTTTAFVKQTAHVVAVTCTSATAFVKQVAHKVTVTCTSAVAAISAIKVKLQTITVACTTATALGSRQVGKAITVASTTAVTFKRAMTHTVLVTCTGTVVAVKSITHKIIVACSTLVSIIATPIIAGGTVIRRHINLTIFRK